MTSGGKEAAKDGINFINKLRSVANGKISIMPGGGINSDNLRDFILHNYEWIHLSAKKQANLECKKNTQIPFLEQPIYIIDTDILQKIKNQNNI